MFKGTPQYVVPKAQPEGLVPVEKSTGITPETSQLFMTPQKKGFQHHILEYTRKDTANMSQLIKHQVANI